MLSGQLCAPRRRACKVGVPCEPAGPEPHVIWHLVKAEGPAPACWRRRRRGGKPPLPVPLDSCLSPSAPTGSLMLYPGTDSTPHCKSFPFAPSGNVQECKWGGGMGMLLEGAWMWRGIRDGEETLKSVYGHRPHLRWGDLCLGCPGHHMLRHSLWTHGLGTTTSRSTRAGNFTSWGQLQSLVSLDPSPCDLLTSLVPAISCREIPLLSWEHPPEDAGLSRPLLISTVWVQELWCFVMQHFQDKSRETVPLPSNLWENKHWAPFLSSGKLQHRTSKRQAVKYSLCLVQSFKAPQLKL